MAVDTFKAELFNQIAIYIIRAKLVFRPKGYLDTLEIIYPLKATHFGLLFLLTKTCDDKFKITIEGSLHHYYNNKYYKKEEQNFDDFPIFTMFTVLLELQEFLQCDLEEFELRSFEFGINIRCGKTARLFLNKLRYFAIKYGAKKEGYSNNGLMITFEPTQILLKFYDKFRESYLYKSDKLGSYDDLIRFELKYLRSRIANKEAGIKTLKDFLDIAKISKMFDVLQSHWSNILMEDRLDPLDGFSKKELEIFQKGVTHDFFSDPLKVNFVKGLRTESNTPKNINLRRQRYYMKYVDILERYNLRSEYHEFTPKLKSHCDFLMYPENIEFENIMIFMFKHKLNLADSDLRHIISGLRRENLFNSKTDSELEEMIEETQRRLHLKGL